MSPTCSSHFRWTVLGSARDAPRGSRRRSRVRFSAALRRAGRGGAAVPAQLQDVRPERRDAERRHLLGRLAEARRERPRLVRVHRSVLGGRPSSGSPSTGPGTYDSGTWTSDWTTLDFPFTELVSSWNSKTPSGTWIQSEVQPKLDNGVEAKWYKLGRWSYGDSDFHRTSVGGQGDADGFVSIDTFFTKDHPATAYRLRLTLFRRAGSTATPAVSRYSAVASDLRNRKSTFPSATTMGGIAKDLVLQPYSQEIHHGHYPEFDNGGEAWCSPTSTAMVVKYWGSALCTDGDGDGVGRSARRSRGRLHRALRLRLPLPGRGQLAVQRRVRVRARAGRRRHATAQPA